MKLQLEIENRKPLEMAIDMAIASARRAINNSKRPEFTAVYEKEIATLMAAKTSITEVNDKTK